MLIDANVPRPADRGGKLQKLTDTIDRLYRRNARVPLQKVMSRVHPADLAGVLGDLPEQHVVPVFRLIPDRAVAAEVFNEVHNRIRELILSETPFEQLILIFDELPPDELTDLVRQLEPELAERIMAALAKDSKSELENLLQYAAETAGGIMTTDCFALTEDVPVEEAVKAIRSVEDR
jgi:magnesium transporter